MVRTHPTTPMTADPSKDLLAVDTIGRIGAGRPRAGPSCPPEQVPGIPGKIAMRVTVILHERLGNWNRQLRPRLARQHVRWFESRSTADLGAILVGIAFPVVLIDLARQPADGLNALDLVRSRSPEARCLVLDPETRPDIRGLARELGATHVCSGFVPPPFVAGLVDRWIDMARQGIESAGWSLTTFPETATEPWSWLADHLLEPVAMTASEPVLRPASRPNPER